VKFMVVDDDLYMIEVITAFLKKEQCDVISYADISDGIRYIMQERVDGVILDLHMPGMNAFDAIPILREIAPETFIGIVTSDTSASARHNALMAGADFFLEKPNEIPQIIEAVEVCRSKRKLAVSS